MLVVVAERRLEHVRTFAAEYLPTRAVGITAGIRIEEEGDDGVAAQSLEEILAAGARPVRAPLRGHFFVEGAEDFVLLFRSSGGEFIDRWKKFFGTNGEFGEAFAVIFLVVDSEGGESLIDEVSDAGFMCAGGVIGGNDARCDCIDLDGLFGGEESELGSGGPHGFVGVPRGREQSGKMREDPDSAEATASLRQQITATEIIFHSRTRRHKEAARNVSRRQMVGQGETANPADANLGWIKIA